jgi:hypothetical protein
MSHCTGAVVRLLGTTEARLQDLIRRGKVQPPPPISAGRRQWYAAHIFQAAKLLGVLTPELEAHLRDDVEARP